MQPASPSTATWTSLDPTRHLRNPESAPPPASAQTHERQARPSAPTALGRHPHRGRRFAQQLAPRIARTRLLLCVLQQGRPGAPGGPGAVAPGQIPASSNCCACAVLRPYPPTRPLPPLDFPRSRPADCRVGSCWFLSPLSPLSRRCRRPSEKPWCLFRRTLHPLSSSLHLSSSPPTKLLHFLLLTNNSPSSTSTASPGKDRCDSLSLFSSRHCPVAALLKSLSRLGIHPPWAFRFPPAPLSLTPTVSGCLASPPPAARRIASASASSCPFWPATSGAPAINPRQSIRDIITSPPHPWLPTS